MMYPPSVLDAVFGEQSPNNALVTRTAARDGVTPIYAYCSVVLRPVDGGSERFVVNHAGQLLVGYEPLRWVLPTDIPEHSFVESREEVGRLVDAAITTFSGVHARVRA